MAATESNGWYEEDDVNIEDSAVIDLSNADTDPSDGIYNDLRPARDNNEDEHKRKMDEEEVEGDLQKKLMDAMKSQVADTMWETGKTQAKKAFDLYANIDILRPYFDVEPKQVVSRLVFSFVPRKPSGSPQKVPSELYGPVMIVFTLIAILIMGMKDSGHTVREGTLMGTSMGICFGYWLIASGIFYTIAYITNTYISMVQVLSLTGYSMFSFCVILFYGIAMHSVHSHTIFYSVWCIFGGLSAAKMVCVYLSRTTGKSQRMLMIGSVVSLHLLFILYLHFSYHKILTAESYIAPPQHGVIQERAANDFDMPKNIEENKIEKIPLNLPANIDLENVEHEQFAKVVDAKEADVEVADLTQDAVDNDVVEEGDRGRVKERGKVKERGGVKKRGGIKKKVRDKEQKVEAKDAEIVDEKENIEEVK